MNKLDRPLLVMLNYLDEPYEADAFVGFGDRGTGQAKFASAGVKFAVQRLIWANSQI